jgi:hypothetical protein
LPDTWSSSSIVADGANLAPSILQICPTARIDRSKIRGHDLHG